MPNGALEQEMEYFGHLGWQHQQYSLGDEGYVNFTKAEEEAFMEYLNENRHPYTGTRCYIRAVEGVGNSDRDDFWIEGADKIFVIEINEHQHRHSNYPIQKELARPLITRFNGFG